MTLEGAADGVLFYIKPEWERLTSPNVWADAASQVFYSFGIACSSLVTFASYNHVNKFIVLLLIFLLFALYPVQLGRLHVAIRPVFMYVSSPQFVTFYSPIQAYPSSTTTTSSLTAVSKYCCPTCTQCDALSGFYYQFSVPQNGVVTVKVALVFHAFVGLGCAWSNHTKHSPGHTRAGWDVLASSAPAVVAVHCVILLKCSPVIALWNGGHKEDIANITLTIIRSDTNQRSVVDSEFPLPHRVLDTGLDT